MTNAENTPPVSQESQLEYVGPSDHVSPGEEWSKRAKIASYIAPLAVPFIALMSADNIHAKTVKDDLNEASMPAYEQHLDAESLQALRSVNDELPLEPRPFGTPMPDEISKPFTAVLPVAFNKGKLGHVDPIPRVTEVPPPTATTPATEVPIPVEYEFNIGIGTGYSPAPDSQSPWQQLNSVVTEGNYEYLGYVRQARGAGAADFPQMGWRVFREKVAEGEEPKPPVFILEDKAPVTVKPGKEDIRYEGALPQRINRSPRIQFNHQGEAENIHIPGTDGWTDAPTKVRWDINNIAFSGPNSTLDILLHHRSYIPKSPAVNLSFAPNQVTITTVRTEGDTLGTETIVLPRMNQIAYEIEVHDNEAVVTFYDTSGEEDVLIESRTLPHDPYDRMEPYMPIPLEVHNRMTANNVAFDGAASVITEANLTSEQRPELNLDDRINDQNHSGIEIVYDHFMPGTLGQDALPIDIQGGTARVFYYDPESISDNLYLQHLREAGVEVLPVLTIDKAAPGNSELPIESTLEDFRRRVSALADQTSDDYLTIEGVLRGAGNNFVDLYDGDRVAMMRDVTTILVKKGKKSSLDVMPDYNSHIVRPDYQQLLDDLKDAEVQVDRIGINLQQWALGGLTKPEIIQQLLQAKERWGVELTFHKVSGSERYGPNPREEQWWREVGEIGRIVEMQDSICVYPYSQEGNEDRGLHLRAVKWDTPTRQWIYDTSKKGVGLYRRQAYGDLLNGINGTVLGPLSSKQITIY